MDIGYRCYGGHQFFHHQLQFRPQTGICLMPGIHSFPCCSVNPGAVTQSRSGKTQLANVPFFPTDSEAPRGQYSGWGPRYSG